MDEGFKGKIPLAFGGGSPQKVDVSLKRKENGGSTLAIELKAHETELLISLVGIGFTFGMALNVDPIPLEENKPCQIQQT